MKMFITICFILFFCPDISGDKIHLKNGKILGGECIKKIGKKIHFRAGKKTIIVHEKNIQNVKLDEEKKLFLALRHYRRENYSKALSLFSQIVRMPLWKQEYIANVCVKKTEKTLAEIMITCRLYQKCYDAKCRNGTQICKSCSGQGVRRKRARPIYRNRIRINPKFFYKDCYKCSGRGVYICKKCKGSGIAFSDMSKYEREVFVKMLAKDSQKIVKKLQVIVKSNRKNARKISRAFYNISIWGKSSYNALHLSRKTLFLLQKALQYNSPYAVKRRDTLQRYIKQIQEIKSTIYISIALSYMDKAEKLYKKNSRVSSLKEENRQSLKYLIESQKISNIARVYVLRALKDGDIVYPYKDNVKKLLGMIKSHKYKCKKTYEKMYRSLLRK